MAGGVEVIVESSRRDPSRGCASSDVRDAVDGMAGVELGSMVLALIQYGTSENR